MINETTKNGVLIVSKKARLNMNFDKSEKKNNAVNLRNLQKLGDTDPFENDSFLEDENLDNSCESDKFCINIDLTKKNCENLKQESML